METLFSHASNQHLDVDNIAVDGLHRPTFFTLYWYCIRHELGTKFRIIIDLTARAVGTQPSVTGRRNQVSTFPATLPLLFLVLTLCLFFVANDGLVVPPPPPAEAGRPEASNLDDSAVIVG